MENIPYILPWVLVVLGLGLSAAVKFLPFKSIAGAIVITLLFLSMIGAGVYSNLLPGEFEARVAKAKQEVNKTEEWKYQHLDELALIIAKQNHPTDKQVALLKEFLGYGWVMENEYVTRIQDAHKQREILKTDLPAFERARYLIKGVPTNVDEKILDLNMRQLGYIVVPYREDEPKLNTVNVLYFGRDVDTLTLKLTALTLIQAGIDIKEIKPFPKPTKGNQRAVKLDWNKYFEARSPLAIKTIVEKEQFK